MQRRSQLWRRARRRLAAALGVCLLPGCCWLWPAVPEAALRQRILPPLPDFVEPAPFPPSPEPAEPACVSPADGTLSLEQAIAYALKNNPGLQVVRERVEQARAGKQVAFADFLPSADTNLRNIRSNLPVALPTIPSGVGNVAFGGESDNFQLAELHVQMTLWDFGRTPGRYGQALESLKIAELQYRRARQTVAFNVTAAYFAVLDSRATRLIAEEAVRRAESHLRDAENFLKRGTAVRNDVLRAEVLLADARLAQVRARTAEGVAVAGLNQVLGANVSAPTQVADRTAEPAFRLALPQALELAVNQREEFQVVLRAVASAELGVGVAKADFWPRIYVGGTGGLQEAKGIRDAELVTGGVNIALDLFEGGRRVGQLNNARSEVRAAVARGKEVCDRIAYEVTAAYLAIDDARQRIDLARTAQAQARENRRLVEGLFRQGDATSTDVVDAELILVRAEQNWYAALYDYQTALARFAYAVGTPVETMIN